MPEYERVPWMHLESVRGENGDRYVMVRGRGWGGRGAGGGLVIEIYTARLVAHKRPSSILRCSIRHGPLTLFLRIDFYDPSPPGGVF